MAEKDPVSRTATRNGYSSSHYRFSASINNAAPRPNIQIHIDHQDRPRAEADAAATRRGGLPPVPCSGQEARPKAAHTHNPRPSQDQSTRKTSRNRKRRLRRSRPPETVDGYAPGSPLHSRRP